MTKRKSKSRSEKRQPKVKKATERSYSRVEKLKTQLAAQQEDFQRQWKEVKRKYPLVALAFHMQQATMEEISYWTRIEHTAIYSLYEAPTGGRRMTEEIRRRRCKKRLEECLDGLRWDDALGRLNCFLEY